MSTMLKMQPLKNTQYFVALINDRSSHHHQVARPLEVLLQ